MKRWKKAAYIYFQVCTTESFPLTTPTSMEKSYAPLLNSVHFPFIEEIAKPTKPVNGQKEAAMKQLYLIGGPMGVGKTTVCQLLKAKLPRSVFLDGDWCWDANPFQVTEETRAMVLDNICHLLNNFLRCSAYDHVLFCWVLHRQDILDAILDRLDLEGCRVFCLSLVCSPAALAARLEGDIQAGRRTPDVLARSAAYLPLYAGLSTRKLDVTSLTPEQAAEALAALCAPAPPAA